MEEPLPHERSTKKRGRDPAHDEMTADSASRRKAWVTRSRQRESAQLHWPASSGALLTAKDLHAMLQISVKTIYRYTQRGLIPYIKIQSNVQFQRQEILEWIGAQSFRPSRPK